MIRIRLLDVLEEKEISQRKLARMTGLRPATIGEICKNNRSFIYLYHLDVISRVLDIHPHDLIEYDLSKPHPNVYNDKVLFKKKNEG